MNFALSEMLMHLKNVYDHMGAKIVGGGEEYFFGFRSLSAQITALPMEHT